MNTEARQRLYAIIEQIKGIAQKYRELDIPPDSSGLTTQADDLMLEAVRLTGWPELADAYKEFLEA